MCYIVSVDDSALRRHPESARIKCFGDRVIVARRYSSYSSFYIGHEDGRHYFNVHESDIKSVVGVFLDSPDSSIDLNFRACTEQNLPPLLRDMYGKFFVSQKNEPVA